MECCCWKPKADSNLNAYPDSFRWGDVLGQGSFGRVYECERIFDNQKMACKVINAQHFDKKNFELVKAEMKTMRKLSGVHPVLLKVFDVRWRRRVARIFTEVCEGGTLQQAYMTGTLGSEEEILQIMKQLVSCLAFLHKNRIAHMDLKPQNVAFLDNVDRKIKLLDFGCAEKRKGIDKVRGKLIGTASFMAPEVVMEKGFTEAADMWSVGIMMYLFLTDITLVRTKEEMKRMSNKK